MLTNRGTRRPDGIVITVEFETSDIEQAEDTALTVGMRLSSFLAIHTGSPLGVPRMLSRLAEVGAQGGVIEQRKSAYYYVEAYHSRPQAPLDPVQLETLMRRVAAKGQKMRTAIELAMRWYGIAVGFTGPSGRLLSDLDRTRGLGGHLDEVFHPLGSRARCNTCETTSGVKRERGLTGILHLIKISAPEILADRTIKDVQQIRHDIAHSLQSESQNREIAASLVQDLLLCLGVSILKVAQPPTASSENMRSALPREYDVRPESMAWLRSDCELPAHVPYLGDWIPIQRELVNETTMSEPTGQYVVGYEPNIRYAVTAQEKPHLSHGYVEFIRKGLLWNFMGEPQPEQRAWRDRPSPAWRRILNTAI